MPTQRPLTVISYAAGASLAAATLIYLFSPTLFLDERSPTWLSRRAGVVGLVNNANDCFINSVLQALAPLGDLRVFLIQEIHRRSQHQHLSTNAANDASDAARQKEAVLRQGIVTQALKDILDKLNERPLASKTITAASFIYALEVSFGTRIRRQQQDAQEFFQVVAERLLDESVAAHKARALNSSPSAAENGSLGPQNPKVNGGPQVADGGVMPLEKAATESSPGAPDRITIPFEGKLESVIQCQVCQFQPKSSVSTFVNLTLNVPQKTSTSLDECFDGLMKQEIIDDYRCDLCRLRHALGLKVQAMHRSSRPDEIAAIKKQIERIEQAISEDPEQPPQGANLPELKYAPRGRVTKHTQILAYPKILVVHLSRSIFDMYSTKNNAKVAFGERITLGGILNRRRYRLLALVTHQGAHNSGHYITYRRQITNGLGSSLHAFDPTRNNVPGEPLLAAELAEDASIASETQSKADHPTVSPRASATSFNEVSSSDLGPSTRQKAASNKEKVKSRKRDADKWWKMSDESIRECRTSAVLSMQKDAYMLFYELESTS